jgi:glycosyltransferase involved in cell wall biosynthesis
MHLNAKFALKFLYPLFDGVIVISSWLRNRYKSKGGKLVTLPPMIEVKPFKTIGCFSKDSLKLIYAGSPGIKDELNTVISAVNNINCGSNLVELLILIPHKKYLNNLKNIDGNSIKVEVGVSHQNVHKDVGSADFSIIIRESKKFTNAGFPTKFVESLAAKTPVIANLTSDLGKYLIDTENGFVVNSTSPEDIEAVIRKAQLLSQEELKVMSKNAELTAQRFFSFTSYTNEIEGFLKNVEEDNV